MALVINRQLLSKVIAFYNFDDKTDCLTCAELQVCPVSFTDPQANSGVIQIQPDRALLLWELKGQEEACLAPRPELQCQRKNPGRPRRQSWQLEKALGISERHSDGTWLSTGKGHIALRKNRSMIMKTIRKHKYALIVEGGAI